jgi:two-component system NtrC family sensor kinase
LLSRIRGLLRSLSNEREKMERFEQLNLLHSVSSVLASSLDPEVLLKGTLSVLISYMRADAGAVFLRNAETGAMTVVTTEGINSPEEYECNLLDLYSRTSPLMSTSPLCFEMLPESAKRIAGAEHVSGVSGLICAPLGLKGNTFGGIFLFSFGGAQLPRQQVELLSTICNQLSIALENARLYVETRKNAAHLSFVYNLGNNLMTTLEMDELLGYAVFTVGKSLECDVCAVIVGASTDAENFASAIYWRAHEDKHMESDWYHVDRVASFLKSGGYGVQATIEARVSQRILCDNSIMVETIVPLVFDDSLIGVLICGSQTPRTVTLDDKKILGAVAQRLSLAIRNTELYRRTKNTSINLAVEVSRRTREAEEQKRFTEKIIDSLPVSLYVVDRDMRIVAWNRNREVGGLGINREQVLGKNVFNVLTRQPRRLLEEEFVDVFRSGSMVRMEQESWVDGEKKVWKISKIPMRVDNAEVTHVITVGEDVTEQKQMNEAVIHAEKLASIGRLAAGVVHEINNPLATIAACAEALNARMDDLQGSLLHEDFGEYLQIIRDEAFRCKQITNSLLEFSHQRQAEKVASDLNHVIEQTLQLLKHHPKLGKMGIVRELDESLPPVYVNEGQMKQVMIALISNAYDAMEGGGTLTINTRWDDTPSGRQVCAEFKDTGCGIAGAHLAKIFDPFFTTKPLGRGTGLGLSVCYGIVSEHGGKIEVDSAQGKGTTFRVILPVYHQAAEQLRGRAMEGMLEMESVL